MQCFSLLLSRCSQQDKKTTSDIKTILLARNSTSEDSTVASNVAATYKNAINPTLVCLELQQTKFSMAKAENCFNYVATAQSAYKRSNHFINATKCGLYFENLPFLALQYLEGRVII